MGVLGPLVGYLLHTNSRRRSPAAMDAGYVGAQEVVPPAPVPAVSAIGKAYPGLIVGCFSHP